MTMASELREAATTLWDSDVDGRVVDLLRSAASELERLDMLIDPEVSFQDMEAKIKDGTIDITVLHEGPSPAIKWLAAIMLHAALGEGEHDEPPNYTTMEFSFNPAGGFEKVRASIEVIKPGGKSSHEIRRELEAQMAATDD